uniref:Uncharacterized protein n=1 Tax=Globodera rostochiensis TaxID=31243 RepID=A0A914I141_GLORO
MTPRTAKKTINVSQSCAHFCVTLLADGRFSATFFGKVSIGRIRRANGPHSPQPFHSRQQMMTLPQAIGLRGPPTTEAKVKDGRL